MINFNYYNFNCVFKISRSFFLSNLENNGFSFLFILFLIKKKKKLFLHVKYQFPRLALQLKRKKKLTVKNVYLYLNGI